MSGETRDVVVEMRRLMGMDEGRFTSPSSGDFGGDPAMKSIEMLDKEMEFLSGVLSMPKEKRKAADMNKVVPTLKKIEKLAKNAASYWSDAGTWEDTEKGARPKAHAK